MHITFTTFTTLYNDFISLAMALSSNHCISETGNACCCTPLESLLDGLIGGTFISRRRILSTRRERLTAIAVPLVGYHMLCHNYTKPGGAGVSAVTKAVYFTLCMLRIK